MSLNDQSVARLEGVHPSLVKVVELAAEKVEFRVLEGVRTPERQRELYGQGRTAAQMQAKGLDAALAKPTMGQVTWTLNSNHFRKADGYGHAVDLFPAPYSWTDLPAFDAMSRAMFEAAHELGIAIRWGADWDRDGKARERGESDSPHFELAPGAVAAAPISPRTLKLGSKGPAVTALQRKLATHGNSINLKVDGDFGPATEAALKAWQRANGLTDDGIAGTKTLTKLGL